MMTALDILAIGYRGYPQFSHQLAVFAREGLNPIVIEPYLAPDTSECSAWAWSEAAVIWQGRRIPIETLAAVYVAALPPEFPLESDFDHAKQGRLSWSDWYQLFGVARDRADSLLGLLLALERRGIPFYNPPSRTLLSRRKPYQLQVLRECGCRVPNTMVTNDVAQAHAFLRNQGEVIVKPVAGGAFTRSANALSDRDWAQLKMAPAIFQKRIRGRNLRVMVIDGRVVSSVAIELPDDDLDFRGNARYQQGQAQYAVSPLPDEVVQQCQRASLALGLRLTGIDIKQTADEEYVFLECNSSPIYLDVENKLAHPITETLALALRAPPVFEQTNRC